LIPQKKIVRIAETREQLFALAAAEFITRAHAAVDQRGRFTVALSGGSTPRGLYNLLAEMKPGSIPWDKIYFFWGDERHVPPDHPESNYRMAREALLSKILVPARNIFRIHGEDDAARAAADYSRDLQTFFQLQAGQFPRFDLILLGIGPDGHTASLFPDSAALNDNEHLVVANWVEKFKSYRITFTYPVLNHAASVIFLVSGKDKASIIQAIFENRDANLPVQKVQPQGGEILWLLDKAAAGQLAETFTRD
jgi:6-phosphogluconolactonase